MPLGTNNTTVTVADKWIPAMWEDDAIATYKGKTVMANLVKKIPLKGKKGDTVYLPNPSRGEASTKTAGSQVTLIADTAADITLSINKHYEYSKLYEDVADIQALNGIRPFYTDDAGYALAKRIDRELHKLGATFQAGSIAGATNLYETAVIGGDGSTAFSGASNGNGTALTDAGFRKMIQTLEDNDISSDMQNFVIPPVEANVMRSIARFTEQAFRGEGNALRTGRLGNIYGVEIFISSLCPYIHCNSVTNTQSVNFSSTTLTTSYVDEFGFTVDWATSTPTDTKYRACMLFHKDAMLLGEQMGMRVQQQYKQEYLGYLVTADCLFGVTELRDYGGIVAVVPA